MFTMFITIDIHYSSQAKTIPRYVNVTDVFNSANLSQHYFCYICDKLFCQKFLLQIYWSREDNLTIFQSHLYPWYRIKGRWGSLYPYRVLWFWQDGKLCIKKVNIKIYLYIKWRPSQLELQKSDNGGLIINRSNIIGTGSHWKKGHLDEIVTYRNWSTR